MGTPQYPPGYSSGNQNGNLLYGTEYENTGALDKNANKDAACAVCQTAVQAKVYVQWGRRTCSNGHKTEYAGLIMATTHTQKKSQHICVDLDRAYHARSSNTNNNGALLYTTEMEAGSSDETQYPTNREISCAVCSTDICDAAA